MAARKAGLALKVVNKIIIRFCPFEPNSRSVREFLTLVTSRKVRDSNKKCEIVTEVKHDSSEPAVDITFLDGEQLIMKTKNLTSKEMILALQNVCIAKEPQGKPGDM
ncbi:hypothetical protein DNTS_025456 [Danionella cerebrum]|uniref:Large ribosomal subunit protein mL53 n=1 Tax=Danionella cerebrum TaxID=2873325 RepID=A0A553Q368_9TELE|nr:hypothetical protein DNTS_025456 [Danionella translucida]